MAKQTGQRKAPDEPKRYCGDCALGTWVEGSQNLDWEKKPICLTCPHRQYHILRSQFACDKFTKRQS